MRISDWSSDVCSSDLCSFYDNKVAGQKFWAMLDKGASQPWQETMKELTGSEQIDGSAVLEYFAPLQEWLKQQNEGQACGWQVPAPQAAEAAKGEKRSEEHTSEHQSLIRISYAVLCLIKTK